MNHLCLNCGKDCSNQYCAHCGQKTATKRISFSAILHDIPHSVFHLDKGFFYTFIQLMKRPGPAIRDYIAGKRVNHVKPLGYLVVLSTISSLFTHLQISWLEHFRHQRFAPSPYLFSHSLSEFFFKFPALMFCLMVPLMSLWSYLCNRQSQTNYAENLVLNMYIIAQFNIFIVLNGLLMMLIGLHSASMTPMLTLFFLYTALVYSTFFKKPKVWTTVLMYLALVLTVITALSVCGFMTPWWGVG